MINVRLILDYFRIWKYETDLNGIQDDVPVWRAHNPRTPAKVI